MASRTIFCCKEPRSHSEMDPSKLAENKRRDGHEPEYINDITLKYIKSFLKLLMLFDLLVLNKKFEHDILYLENLVFLFT